MHLKHSTKVKHRRATAAAAKHKVTRQLLANNHARSLRAAHRTQRRSLKDKPRLRAFNDKYFDAGAEEIGPGQQGKPQQSHTTSVHGGKPRVVPPSRVALYRGSLFGRPSTAHSFTQEASGETILHPFLKYGSTYSTDEDIAALLSSHPLIEHLDDMRNAMTGYDFGWIRETDTKWASRRAVCKTRSRAMMAALLHYDLDVSALIRYLGNNYTGEYRLPNISAVANILTKYNIPQYLIDQYQRILVQGCPAHFVADTTRDNALEYWRGGNNPSINANLDSVMATMAKEDRNAFVIALPSWLWRFIPHVFRIPHHLLVIPKKKDRLICDASFRHSAASVSANMMTSTDQGVELVCEYGAIRKNILTRIWNLRITYPTDDIVIHANDVKSCFRQLKHHPDVAGAFSYILGDFLFVQCSLTFGADFSPSSWKGICRIAELLAEALFDDKSLRTKHRKYLDLLKFGRDLGRKAVRTVAKKMP